MSKILTDTRTMTLDDAKATFADLAQARLRVVKREAQADVRIAAIKAKTAVDNAEDAARVARAEERLTRFILANPGLFKRPRQVRTPLGRFGLRTAAKLDVVDDDDAIEALMDLGYDDCVEIVRKLDKAAVTKRIQAGEQIPGCAVQSGDLATYTVDSALLKEAKETD